MLPSKVPVRMLLFFVMQVYIYTRSNSFQTHQEKEMKKDTLWNIKAIEVKNGIDKCWNFINFTFYL